MGGVSKADLSVGGTRLLDTAIQASGGASTIVVVGDVVVPPDVVRTREVPAGTGPAAGLLAGLDAVVNPARWTLVLACDLPDATTAVAELREAWPHCDLDTDGVVMRDDDGQPQLLLGAYRTTRLRQAFAAFGDPRDRSVRGALSPLRLTLIDPVSARVDDLDTPAQLARWERRYGARSGSGDGPEQPPRNPEER